MLFSRIHYSTLRLLAKFILRWHSNANGKYHRCAPRTYKYVEVRSRHFCRQVMALLIWREGKHIGRENEMVPMITITLRYIYNIKHTIFFALSNIELRFKESEKNQSKGLQLSAKDNYGSQNSTRKCCALRLRNVMNMHAISLALLVILFALFFFYLLQNTCKKSCYELVF